MRRHRPERKTQDERPDRTGLRPLCRRTMEGSDTAMDASQQQTRTRLFARVLGPFLVIVDLTAVARASEMPSLLAQFEANSLWTWVSGAFILLFGLVMVGGHQYWRGAAAIIVSLLGWLITLRGVLLFAFPQTFVSAANSMIGAQAWWVA